MKREPTLGQPVITATYRGSQQYIQQQMERDATRFLGEGYRIESQQIIPGRRGCLGTFFGAILLGIPFLFWRPADAMLVTYRLEGGYTQSGGRDPWKPPV